MKFIKCVIRFISSFCDLVGTEKSTTNETLWKCAFRCKSWFVACHKGKSKIDRFGFVSKCRNEKSVRTLDSESVWIATSSLRFHTKLSKWKNKIGKFFSSTTLIMKKTQSVWKCSSIQFHSNPIYNCVVEKLLLD